MSLTRFFRRRQWYRERAAELESYLDGETADNVARGMSAAESRAAAERHLGNRTRILETIWEFNTIAWLDALAHDLRTAWREARQARALTLAAVAILALGIGANTAMFTVVYGELRPLPFPGASRLVAVLEASRQFPRMGVSYPDFLDWRAGNRVFTDLAALRGSDMILLHRGPPAMVIGQRVTANYFSLLGVAPKMGRTFTAAEDLPGAPAVVVISDRFWRQRLGARAACLGETLDLDGHARTIIGVMPPGFPGLEPAASESQFWTPLGAFADEQPSVLQRGNHPGILALGRLRDGVTLAAARADLASIAQQLAQAYPATNQGVTASAQSYLDLVVGDTRPALLLLLAAVGLVLLIACANVASLLLARAAARQQVEALRAALGASRARLIREHLLGALGLGLAGCAGGLLLAHACSRAASAALPETLPRALAPTLQPAVLAFAMAAALLTSLACGLAPALHAGRASIAEVLKIGGRGGAPGGQRMRAGLVVFEMALALLLLLSAGFMFHALARMEHADPGIEPGGTLTFLVGLPPDQYPDASRQSAFFRQTLDRMTQLPGVAAAGGMFPMPYCANDWEEAVGFPGRPAPAAGEQPVTDLAVIRGNVFAALGAHLLQGRLFQPSDTANAPPVAIVDDRFVSHYWPAPATPLSVLGQRIEIDGVTRAIVGVVAHLHHAGMEATTTGVETFIPQEQSAANTGVLFYVLRDAGSDPHADPHTDPMTLRAPALAALAAVDATQPVTDLDTMDQLLAASLADRRRALALLAAFALLALVLAASGVYGVIAYVAARRTHEIGLRMALGARRAQVLTLVMAQGLRLAAAGGALGLAAALLLGRAAASALPDIDWRDPATLVAAPVFLLAVAALASYLPARRATRVDPVIALRSQ